MSNKKLNPEENDSIITLSDEDGNPIKFEFLDSVVYEGEEYAVLLPADEDDDDGMVIILKVESDESGEIESYNAVEDDETLQAVFEIFKEENKEEFNFID